MIRISLPFVFGLCTDLSIIERLPDGPVKRLTLTLDIFQAEFALRQFIENSVYAPYLRASFALGQELLKLLAAQTTDATDATGEADISRYEMWQIKNKYSQYKIALLSEMGTFNSFFVTQKGAFDTTTLLSWGELMFPGDLATKVREAIFDAREAAKCLAFEVPTAAAFHVFRVVEAVLRRYHSQVTGGAAPPRVRNISVYLRAMKSTGDPKILAALKQMVDLHRNPLIHPEAAITLDEAISIAGIGRSAVTAMLGVLPVQAPTTATVTALASAQQASP